MALGRFWKTFAAIAGVVIGVSLLAVLYFGAKDYGGYFLERRGVLASYGLAPAGGDSLFQKYWLDLASESGLTVECGLLVPRTAGRRYPAMILMGGKATGKHAVDYAVDVRDMIIVAPDYPYDPKEKYTIPELLLDVPEIRTALLDMVPSVMLVMDYLSRRDDVDTAKFVLLGYSFGAPLVPPIVAYDRRPAVAAMVYGGGDLYSLIRHNMRRHEGPITSELVALVGGFLLRPLEPMRYIKRIAPIPLLMINGTHDEQIPSANAELLYEAAGEPRKIIWLESRHVHPRNVELTRRIVSELERELTALGIREGQ